MSPVKRGVQWLRQLRTVSPMCAPQGQFCLGCPKTPPTLTVQQGWAPKTQARNGFPADPGAADRHELSQR